MPTRQNKPNPPSQDSPKTPNIIIMPTKQNKPNPPSQDSPKTPNSITNTALDELLVATVKTNTRPSRTKSQQNITSQLQAESRYDVDGYDLMENDDDKASDSAVDDTPQQSTQKRKVDDVFSPAQQANAQNKWKVNHAFRLFSNLHKDMDIGSYLYYPPMNNIKFTHENLCDSGDILSKLAGNQRARQYKESSPKQKKHPGGQYPRRTQSCWDHWNHHLLPKLQK